MKKEHLQYFYLILLHAAFGLIIYLLPITAKIYAYIMFLFGLYLIIKKQNKNDEALLVAAYLVGAEVFLRMTGGNITHEFSKYGVMIIVLVGAYYSGFSKSAVPYWIFMLLLVPGVIIATETLDLDTKIRTTIAFNISGPVCLATASVYTFRRRISVEQMNNVLLCMGLPIISCAIYLMLYTPNIRDVITGTQSSFETSGGYGPNQVATFLGLGMFIFFSRIIFESRTKINLLINLIVVFLISYRGMVTFSRGGMLTGFLMVVLLLGFLYFKSNSRGKLKLGFIVSFIAMALVGIWMYTSYQTGGLIEKRYANQDAQGRVKESKFTGREEIALSEIDMFLEHPFLGVGVAKGAEVRESAYGYFATSHDEITRMLAEHGSLGVLGLMILFFTPLFLFLENSFNMYLLCFLAFWFLTINHAAMRTAAPAFVYALALLNVQIGSPEKRNASNEVY